MEEYTFIDLDGVILDSEERMLERKYDVGFTNHKDRQEYDKYFDYTLLHPEEWNYIIREAKSINNSVEIIKELESLKKKIAILTKIHTFDEMRTKTEDIREHRGIKCPIIFVPSGIKKHQIIIPNRQLLVDDSKKNIKGWIENGGEGKVFDSTISENNDTTVRSLEFLLKR